jgi:hypothetical protein
MTQQPNTQGAYRVGLKPAPTFGYTQAPVGTVLNAARSLLVRPARAC